jgi:hypothetical protein
MKPHVFIEEKKISGIYSKHKNQFETVYVYYFTIEGLSRRDV